MKKEHFPIIKIDSEVWQERDLFIVPDVYHNLIREETRKALTSPDSTATEQQRKFLSHVVSEVLADRANNIKGYTVATQVFGRSENFDASLDPIVSFQANKLRRALERYYLLEGKFDTIVIDIPKGTYVPTFNPRTPEPQEESGNTQKAAARPRRSWSILQINPLTNNTGDPEKDYIGTGISAERAIEISQFDNFRLFISPISFCYNSFYWNRISAGASAKLVNCSRP